MALNRHINDPSQQKAIEAQGGEHLVLAPPGCGKTHILAERLRLAHERGVDYGDMLCLTFTNRAARSMTERIRRSIDDSDAGKVYVGNVHRFCSRFLFDNALVGAETSVIDDDDIISIMARYMDEDEAKVAAMYKRRNECFDAVHLAALMRQIERGYPKELRLHPECLGSDDIAALRLVCDMEHTDFTPAAMAAIYHDAPACRERLRSEAYPTEMIPAVEAMLKKMQLACYYDGYKRDNRLVDFEDLLLLTYEALIADEQHAYKRYAWCQVDEVQDLNPLQLKIIDLLASKARSEGGSVMFLGDEQQAIFSFMGAKMSTLEQLKRRCEGRVHRLAVNHRSPDYLLSVFNTYAEEVLGISEDFLPRKSFSPVRTGDELCVLCSPTLEAEYSDAAQQAWRLAEQNPDETTAVLVCSNADADVISRRMDEMGVSHFKVSGTDLFSTPEMKLLLAHLAVFANEHNFIAWSRLLKGLHVYEQNAAARAFVRQLMDRAMLPTDLMTRPNGSYVMDFAHIYETREIVVFDTETTGLNVHEDDILQIAAVKMKGGAVVEGSEFAVFIESERPVPAMLGDIVNPIIEERKRHELLPASVALRRFLDYLGEDAVLLGHNASYDFRILEANLQRHLPGEDLWRRCPVCLDSLKLMRLLEPQLRQYKLKSLLAELHLEGENSHLADADVAATCNVVRYCYRRSREVVPLQREFLELRSTRERAEKIRRKVWPLYHATLTRLYGRQTPEAEPLVVVELRNLYSYLVREAIIKPVRGVEYAFRYISREMVSPADDTDLYDQIARHVLEMSTLKESDLCSRGIVDERVFVTTVHKAKGLEFDNVIVFDATDDRYPGFFSRNNPAQVAEDARKFYVALTRARRRIVVMVSAAKPDYQNRRVGRDITRFMQPIASQFVSRSTDSPESP